MTLRLLASAALLAVPALLHGQAASRPVAERPTLVLFVTVDQLRPDYFDRWPGQLTGGLARLARDGAFYVNAVHDHGTTETAPGHASTMSGRFPASTGIVRNNAGVGDSTAPLLHGQRGLGASPFRFRGGTLFDWMRSRDPRSRALSVSRKDRGAILPVGRAHQEVYWYGGERGFTTSTYYRDTLPAWVQRFNARGGHRRWAGQQWTLLLPESQYPEPDSVRWESAGRNFTFPHPAPADSAQAARALPDFPWMDQLTLEMALEGVNALGLGRGPSTDVLAVSLSATDAVGHRFGPDSREVHDNVVRLDRMLGAFLDSLFRLRDSTRIVIALTADHGVAPIPEVHFAGQPNATLRANLHPLVNRTTAALRARGVPDDAFDFEYGMLLTDRAALRAAGVDPDSLVRGFLAAARGVPGVLRADTRAALARADTVKDAIARRWLHATPPDLDVVAYVTLQPYVYWAPSGAVATGASHGSPHDYDARVPVLFWGRDIVAGRRTERARVVDMAPTLARVLGVTPTERLDGRVLVSALRPAPRAAAPGAW
jgi:predicted AlkP superfamily pyrophosphatase or phosphodiesterase